MAGRHRSVLRVVERLQELTGNALWGHQQTQRCFLSTLGAQPWQWAPGSPAAAAQHRGERAAPLSSATALLWPSAQWRPPPGVAAQLSCLRSVANNSSSSRGSSGARGRGAAAAAAADSDTPGGAAHSRKSPAADTRRPRRPLFGGNSGDGNGWPGDDPTPGRSTSRLADRTPQPPPQPMQPPPGPAAEAPGRRRGAAAAIRADPFDADSDASAAKESKEELYQRLDEKKRMRKEARRVDRENKAVRKAFRQEEKRREKEEGAARQERIMAEARERRKKAAKAERMRKNRTPVYDDMPPPDKRSSDPRSLDLAKHLGLASADLWTANTHGKLQLPRLLDAADNAATAAAAARLWAAIGAEAVGDRLRALRLAGDLLSASEEELEGRVARVAQFLGLSEDVETAKAFIRGIPGLLRVTPPPEGAPHEEVLAAALAAGTGMGRGMALEVLRNEKGKGPDNVTLVALISKLKLLMEYPGGLDPLIRGKLVSTLARCVSCDLDRLVRLPFLVFDFPRARKQPRRHYEPSYELQLISTVLKHTHAAFCEKHTAFKAWVLRERERLEREHPGLSFEGSLLLNKKPKGSPTSGPAHPDVRRAGKVAAASAERMEGKVGKRYDMAVAEVRAYQAKPTQRQMQRAVIALEVSAISARKAVLKAARAQQVAARALGEGRPVVADKTAAASRSAMAAAVDVAQKTLDLAHDMEIEARYKAAQSRKLDGQQSKTRIWLKWEERSVRAARVASEAIAKAHEAELAAGNGGEGAAAGEGQQQQQKQKPTKEQQQQSAQG